MLPYPIAVELVENRRHRLVREAQRSRLAAESRRDRRGRRTRG